MSVSRTIEVTVRGNALRPSNAAKRAIGSPTHVVLLHDGRTFGIRPADGDDTNAYTVNAVGQILAPAFIKSMGLVDGLYPARVEDGALVFEVES